MTPAPAPTVKTLADAAVTLKGLAKAIHDSPAETMTVIVIRLTPGVATQLVVDLGAAADLVAAAIPAPHGD